MIRPKKSISPRGRRSDFTIPWPNFYFLSCRARRNIQTSVTFLTSRVNAPDENDLGKVRSLYLKLRLAVESMANTMWQVDIPYGVHCDCKGQTGTGMALGKGELTSFQGNRK